MAGRPSWDGGLGGSSTRPANGARFSAASAPRPGPWKRARRRGGLDGRWPSIYDVRPMLSTQDVKKLIEDGIPGATAEVGDLTGTSDHFSVEVTSQAFAGKTRIEQHKMVHKALGEHLTTTIHAVQIKTRVPE